MMPGSDLIAMSAVEQAALVRAGDVSACELLDAHLALIDSVNPMVNAIVTLVPDMARRWARDADDAFATGTLLGPLHGLPIAHKDLEPTAGIRTTMGSPLFAEHVPAEDGLVVERLRGAGAITIGKTNTPELGAGSHTFNPVFGPTLNPYNVTKSCGGSSGGAAVALATNMVPIADGSDMGGSLRNPASFCNIVGFRPTPGRVPTWPTLAPWNVLSTSGPMGRTVADVALLMQVMAGPDARAPISIAEAGSVFAEDLARDLTGCRVAWTADLGLPVDAEVRDALAPVREVLVSLGCEVVDTQPDLRGAREVFQVLRAYQFDLGYGELYDRRGADMKETIRWNIEENRRRSARDIARASVKHAQLVDRVRQFFAGVDVLAAPVTQVAPFPVEWDWVHEVDGQPMETYIDWMRSCTDVTLMGCPAISVPAAFTAGGLPVGIQFVAKARADLGLLRFAFMFEQSTRVGDRRPDLR
jgi:amidase